MTHFTKGDLMYLRGLAQLNDGLEKREALDLIETCLVLFEENRELVRQLDRIDEAARQREDQVHNAFDDFAEQQGLSDFEWKGWEGSGG